MRWVSLVISVVALAVASYAIIVNERLRDQICNIVEQRCVSDCERAHRDETSRITIEENLATLDHRQRLIGCATEPDPVTCRTNEVARFAQVTADFATRKQTADRDRYACEQGCRRRGAECRGEEFQSFEPKPPESVVVECIDAPNAPCFKEVPEICQQIGGVCPDCGVTLCGDPSWNFEADSPVTATLVAGNRTLATSSGSGNKATLAIPKGIQLQPGEKLGLRLETKSRKVTLTRGR